MRSLLLALVGSLALAGTAQAADRYVAAGGSGTPATGCTAAAPCPTIQFGVASSFGAGESTTVHVAAGTYAPFKATGSIPPLVVEGAGSGSTTVAGDAGSTLDGVIGLDAQPASQMTVRGVSVVVPGSTTTTVPGVYAQKGTLTLEDAIVTVNPNGTTAGNGYAVASNPNATLIVRRASLNSHAKLATVLASGDLTMEDSAAYGDGANGTTTPTGTVVTTGSTSPSTVRIVRSSLVKDNSTVAIGGALLTQLESGAVAPSIVVDSSVIRGGNAPIDIYEKTQTQNITLQNVTLDQAATQYFLLRESNTLGGKVNLTADSSILRGQYPDFASYTATCTYSDLAPGGANTTGQNHCLPTDATNSSGGDVFSTGYTPAAGSSAVDSGNPGAIPAGFSLSDALGNMRALAGHGGCDGRRDRGAIEYGGNHGTPPTVAIGGPTTQSGAVAGSFTTTTADTVTSAWSTDDGASGSSAGFSHAFTTDGAHLVTLVATKADGCATTVTRSVTVSGLTPTGGGGGGGGGSTTTITTTTTTPTPGTPVPGGKPSTTGPVKTGGPGTGVRDTTKPRITFAKLTATRVTLTLSEPTTVRIKLCRTVKVKGGKAKLSCRKLTGGGGAGKLRIAFKQRLAKGRYVVTLTGVDQAGNTAKAVVKRVTIS